MFVSKSDYFIFGWTFRYASRTRDWLLAEHHYCGVFGYADLALIFPTIFGLKQMITVCELYVRVFLYSIQS